jgi:hypothetical protein
MPGGKTQATFARLHHLYRLTQVLLYPRLDRYP